MKKKLLSIVFMAMGSALLTGCLSSDDNNSSSKDTEITLTKGAVVLCAGETDHHSSLYYVDYEAGTSRVVASDLGVLANDVIEFNNRIYVAGSGSNKIFVLSADNFQMLDQIDTKEEMGETDGIGPRCLTAYDNRLYVTTRAGYVGIFDASSSTLNFLNKVKVGNEPEGIFIDLDENNVPVLYVCCSGSINGSPSVATVKLGSTPSVSSFSNEALRQPMEVVATGDLIFVRDNGYIDDQNVQQQAGVYVVSGSSVTRIIPDATGMTAAGYNILTYNTPSGSTRNPWYAIYSLNNVYGAYNSFSLSGDESAPVKHPSVISVDPNPYASSVLIGSLADDGSGAPDYTGGSFVNLYSRSNYVGNFVKSYPVGVSPVAITYLYKTAKYSDLVK